jgi:hypothetical protein
MPTTNHEPGTHPNASEPSSTDLGLHGRSFAGWWRDIESGVTRDHRVRIRALVWQLYTLSHPDAVRHDGPQAFEGRGQSARHLPSPAEIAGQMASIRMDPLPSIANCMASRRLAREYTDQIVAIPNPTDRRRFTLRFVESLSAATTPGLTTASLDVLVQLIWRTYADIDSQAREEAKQPKNIQSGQVVRNAGRKARVEE